MKNKGIGLALAGLVALSLLVITTTSACAQQNITVSIGDISLPPQAYTTIPIMITNDTAQDVSAATINLTYNSNVVQVTAVGGSDFEGFNFDIVDGKVRMVGYLGGEQSALNTPIKFAEVTIKAIGDVGAYTTLNLEIDELSDDGPMPIFPREVSNGSVSVAAAVPEYNDFGLVALIGLLAVILAISARVKRK